MINTEIYDLNQEINEIENEIKDQTQYYGKIKSSGHIWSGNDFSQLYKTNQALLEIIKKQNILISDLFKLLHK